MFIPGLVSITFRQLNIEEIVDLVRRAQLEAIEWGGDVHVPPGDMACAQKARRLTSAAGLYTASYGSYYRAGYNDPSEFAQVLETAVELETPIIRIWAGRQGSDESDEKNWAAVIKDSKRVARLAAKENIVVSYEYHAKTLTDTCDGTLRLLREVDEPNLRTHWQPSHGNSRNRNLEELARLHSHLCHIHIFHWMNRERRPLAEGVEDWKTYLGSACETRRDHGVLMEFVVNDNPDQFTTDAATLRSLIKEFQP